MDTKTKPELKTEVTTESKKKLNYGALSVSYNPKKNPLPNEPSKWLNHMKNHSRNSPTYLMFYTKKGQVHIYPMPGFTVVDSDIGPEAPFENVTMVVENPNWVYTGGGWRKIC